MATIEMLRYLKYFASGVFAVLIFNILRAIYYVTFHPLRKFPGPKLWAATRLTYMYHSVKGDLPLVLRDLHDQYGSVIRIAPDELSFITDAWKDIVGGYGSAQLPRDKYIFPPEQPELRGGIIYADAIQHPPMRRQIGHGFSQKALEEQLPLIQSYINLLIVQFQCLAKTNEVFDIAEWLNFISFDIIGHLSYGESFGNLERGKYHPFAAFILKAFEGALFASALNRYGLLAFAGMLMPKEISRRRTEFTEMAKELSKKRIEKKDLSEDQKHDFFSYMMSTDNPEKSMTYGEMTTNATVFMIAGSESTATLLTGTILYLLRDPQRMSKLTSEIRNAFQTEDQISIASVAKLSYMLACLEEGLRIVTPAPFGVARRTTEKKMIAGVEVPKGTSISVAQYAAWHSTLNFARPDEYIPERWLIGSNDEKSEFSGDKRSSFFPFSTGPRNCVGKQLAYLEMRLILARLLWNFDFELVDKDFEWTKQRAAIVWYKQPLMMRIKQRELK